MVTKESVECPHGFGDEECMYCRNDTMLSLLRELEPHLPAIARTFRYIESGKEQEVMDIQRRLSKLLEGLK